MKCPFCSSINDVVIDSRHLDSSCTIRRRRECLNCFKRYTTYEKIEILPVIVIKKNGDKEIFSKNKIRNSLLTACRKRPITIEEIDKIVNIIEYEIQEISSTVSSKVIGDKIIHKLKTIDEIAYMRFFSVYKDFDNLDNFINEIQKYNNKECEE